MFDALRERFEDPPAPRSPRVVSNEHSKADVVDSEEEDEDEEDTEEAKPRKGDNLNVILSKPGGEMAVVDVYKETIKPPETIKASEITEQVKGRAGKQKTKTGKSAKKPKKRWTEMERLSSPVQDELKSRGPSGVKASNSRSLNRTQDSVDEAFLETQDAADEDLSEPAEFW